MIMDTAERNAQLVARCQAGDELALEWLVNDYQPALFRLALSILDDGTPNGPAEAEEATQDAFLTAFHKIDSFRGEAALTTWLYAITVNLCRNRLRVRHRHQKLQSLLQIFWHTDHNHPAQLEETIIQNEANSGLLQAVQALNEKHRLPVILRYYHDLSVNDIAQILDIPAGTVHSRLNKARQQLKSSVVRFNQP